MIADSLSPKILHILNHGLPHLSGYTIRSKNIFQAQCERGWNPVALTAPVRKKSWTSLSDSEDMIEGIRYYRTKALPPGVFPLDEELRLVRALTRRIREVVDVEKPDLLHAHSPVFNALATLRVGRKLGIPVVYEIRSFWEDSDVAKGTYGQHSWKYKLMRRIETWVCRKSDQVVVLCNGIRNDMIKRGIPSKRLNIVYNGVNPDDAKRSEPDESYKRDWKLVGKKVIGYIGSFRKYEGLDLLIDAVGLLTRTRPDTVLLLVGGGRMEAELKAHIRRANLNGNVIMPGWIPHDRIPGVYALLDILAYPRYSSRLTELVTPLKPLEGMAMGKALVASDIGGHRELINQSHTGLLFQAGDVSALAEALTLLLNNTDLRRKIERQASTWVYQKRSWKDTSAVYSDIYAQVLWKMGSA
jgi:PEP-CTERM/exosortase A-associated glycosyltransferase